MAHAAANPMSRWFHRRHTRADGVSSDRPSGNRFGLMNHPWAKQLSDEVRPEGLRGIEWGIGIPCGVGVAG